jgi:hypothetical protein
MGMNGVQYWQYYAAVRSDLVKAAYCYFAGKAIHTFAAESRDNLQRLNAQATFWKTTLHGFQIAWFMALSRFFDEGSDTHTMEKFLRHTVAHPEFFSREAFDARRMQDTPGGVRPDWLDNYVANIWVPTRDDLRDIARMIRPYRQKWRTDYVPVRDRAFAHNIVIDQQGIAALFSRTQIGDIEDILQGLYNILEIIKEIWINGRHPDRHNSNQEYIEEIVPETRELLAQLR